MRAHVSAILVTAAVASASAQPRGVVNGLSVSAAAVDAGSAVSFTTTGGNPCGAVTLDYGDGNAVTHPIRELPATTTYTYSKPGTFHVVAKGTGNCDGEAAATVRVNPPPVPPPPRTPPPADNVAGALDRNRDGVITRDEWRGDQPSFQSHDWNRDGVLSGDEVREAERDDAARRADEERRGAGARSAEAVDRRFAALDRNRDGRISRDEWNGSRDEFEALDRNGDWVIERAEMNPRAAAEPAPGTVAVEASRPWTDTGVSVRAGDLLSFEVTGTVRLSPDPKDVADARGSLIGRRAPQAPVRQANAGALIARIGDSPAVEVGSRSTPIRAPRDGRLYLGVNDDYTGDNQGSFEVRVTVQRPGR